MEDETKKTFKITVFLNLKTTIYDSTKTEQCICSEENVSDGKTFDEQEIIPEMEVIEDDDGKLRLAEVMSKIKALGYPITCSMVYYFSKDIGEYVFCGSDPIDFNNLISKERDMYNNVLKLKVCSYIDETLIPSIVRDNKTSRQTSFSENKGKRTKERKIGFIIDKVNMWRRYYNGFIDESGNFIKHSLDEAAKKIGISKKSLDDYLLQLRLGRKYGFDFNLHKGSKVGVLRTFVKSKKKK